MNLAFFISLGSSFSLWVQSHLTHAAGKRDGKADSYWEGVFKNTPKKTPNTTFPHKWEFCFSDDSQIDTWSIWILYSTYLKVNLKKNT